MIEQSLQLDYKLAPGWLSPWAEAMLEGAAMARRCVQCHRVSFAPLRVCDCGSHAGEWIQLVGTAAVVSRTQGTDGRFALVRFDGADTLVVARLQGFSDTDCRGRLLKPTGSLPSLAIEPWKQPISMQQGA